ncbi:MAG: protein kinase, partial [Myxococcales bacterium]|nr:protein kinase [Myxococcales bacterium]
MSPRCNAMREPGDRIGEVWEVVRPLGSGGMGSVYAAQNVGAPSIQAAVKLLACEHAVRPEARQRFLQEAEVLSGLDHPHIVRVRNVVLDTEPPWLEMELVEGLALSSLIAIGPLPEPRAVHLGRQLLEALAYMHRRRVHHRDV